MAVFLSLNGYEIESSIDEQEKLFLDLAAGLTSREQLVSWISDHSVERSV